MQFAVVVNMCASLMIMLAAFYGYENTWQDSLGWWWGSWEDLQPVGLWYNAVYWVITAVRGWVERGGGCGCAGG